MFIDKVLKERSLSTTFNLLLMMVRSGCVFAFVGYISGKDIAQSLGYRLGVVLMVLSVCHINTFLCYFNILLINICGGVGHFDRQVLLVPLVILIINRLNFVIF